MMENKEIFQYEGYYAASWAEIGIKSKFLPEFYFLLINAPDCFVMEV